MRNYQTESDLLQMQAMLMEAHDHTDDWRYPHVGEMLFSFFQVASHLDPETHIRLWHRSGKLIAYAILGEDPSFDFQVLPEFEWCGIEEEAIAWAEMLVSALCRRDPEMWGGPLVSGARQDNLRRIVFLEEHGFRSEGPFSEVNMLRSMDAAIPDVGIPAGYQIRSMEGLSDIPGRAGAQREVWQPWTVGNVSDENYAYFMQLPGYDPGLDVVAVTPDGVIAAYVNGWIDPVNKIGDFGPVGARPAYRRQGLTRAVLVECLRRMQARGMDRVCVSTGISNTPAIRLYESIGFRAVNYYFEYVKRSRTSCKIAVAR